MAGQLVIMGFFCLYVTILASEKRILMTDPAFVSQELTHMQSEFQELREKVGNQEQTISALQQTVSLLQQKVTIQQSVEKAWCTRDGEERSPTGNDTQLVYSGFAGGSHYTSPGGAANTLCMPPEPVWGTRKDQTARLAGHVYGAEYEDVGVFGMPDLKQDVPCAVCKNTAHSIVTMVPGRATCYPGWTTAFHGLLTSGYPTEKAASEFLCVDDHPQAVLGGGNTDDNGRVFFAVYSKCGSLPCPPYEDGKILSCSVCMM
ncbi:uncharacterized protein LOC117337805 [Pecten maximus]|uniref:uncharacterized protein LOC117337805 n=1 Tax=Pecten maximus TaxID=6579 RepID=UPI00145916A9|nr:uncharacterized protein LOC117337805 [Pecten maximus]